MVLRFLILALTFFFIACSAPERDNPDDPHGINYQGNQIVIPPLSSSSNVANPPQSSSSGGVSPPLPPPSSSSVVSSSSSRASSSSVAVSSSSGVPIQSSCVGGTVTIGTQVWQKCNSDAVPSKGVYKCYENYENMESNCAKYGRLYDWEAANSVCPSGFRLPTKEDWDALATYIEGNKGCSNCDAEYLKTSEWGGSDSYGFSALPGGRGYSGGNFSGVGGGGYWWSASEYDSDRAYSRDMHYSNLNYRLVYNNIGLVYNNINYASWSTSDKSALYSVRCLQD